MNYKRIFLIVAAACAVTLTGCAARSEYYGVFVSEGTYSDITETVDVSALYGNFDGEDTQEPAQTVPAVSAAAPEISVPESPTHEAMPETAEASDVIAPPTSASTTPETAPEPQTTHPAESSASTKPAAPASSVQSAPSTPSTPSTPSVSKTKPSTHSTSTDPVTSAAAPKTPASTKKSETTTATVAAAIDEPAPAEDYINEVLTLVNAERAKEGLSPLVLDSELSKAARVRAEEQIELFGHTRPNGESCFSIFKEYGINYSTAGENAAAGYSTPKDVVEAWMSSDGHRANILKPCFEKLGVGFVYGDDSYGAYWVQLFVEE